MKTASGRCRTASERCRTASGRCRTASGRCTTALVGALQIGVAGEGGAGGGGPDRNKGMQEVEGLVYGGVSVYVALGQELVVDDSLQALGQVQGLLLEGLLLLLNGSRLPLQLDPVLLQVLVLPASQQSSFWVDNHKSKKNCPGNKAWTGYQTSQAKLCIKAC